MRKPFLALVVSALLTVVVSAAAGKTAKGTEPESVGGFAVKLASALGIPATSPEVAVESLRTAGANLGEEALSAPITQKKVGALLSDLGLQVVSPRDPGHGVNVALASQIATTVGLSLSGPIVLSSTDLPTQCLDAGSRGKCKSCCEEVTGCSFPPVSPGAIDCRVCGKFCRANLQGPPSQSEPLP